MQIHTCNFSKALFMPTVAHSGNALNWLGPTMEVCGMQAVTSNVVDGLFSMLASQSIVPIIRCPKVRPSSCVLAS